MSEVLSLSSDKYKSQGKISIDGKVWTVKLPGANSELRLSQLQRKSKLLEARLKLLTDKIESQDFTSSDLDEYERASNEQEEIEAFIIDFFSRSFKDSTKDNSEVKQWIEETPMGIIFQMFDDLRNKANGGSNEQSISEGTQA